MTMTAGMAQGTPDWQLGRMFETETEKDLEKYFNAPDDFPAANVAAFMEKADRLIGQALVALARAGDMADGFGKAGPIDGLIDRLEEIRVDANAYRGGLEGRQ